MSASQFIGPFLTIIHKWEKSMRTITDVIEVWLELQKRWMYLEGIFIGGDIRSQLPEEAEHFDMVDQVFRRVMVDTVKNPNILDCCSIDSKQ
jgi:dynein heavy chain